MGWINTYKGFRGFQDLKYNSCVVTHRIGLEQMMDDFDSFWGDLFDFNDEIASVKIYPFNIPVIPGNTYLYTTRGGTTVPAWRISSEAEYMSLGQCKIDRYYNNYADFKGYTQIKAYIPFVGYVDIDTNECMGKWLQFRMYNNFTTGQSLFIIGVSENEIVFDNYPLIINETEKEKDMRVISVFSAELSTEIPLGSSNFGDLKRNLLLGAVKASASIATGFALSNITPTSTTKTVTNFSTQGRSTAKGSRMKTIRQGTVDKTSTTTHSNEGAKIKSVSNAIDSSVDVVNNLSVQSHADRVNSGNLNTCMSKNIQVVIYRPKIIKQDDRFYNLYGRCLGGVYKLKNLKGYTEVSNIHIEKLNNATDFEIEMIENIFTEGVLLGPKLEEFYVGNPYKFEVGMTFNSWVNSQYNTSGYTILNGYVIGDGGVVSNVDGIPVSDVDVIEPIHYSSYSINRTFTIFNFIRKRTEYKEYEYIFTDTWEDFIPKHPEFTYDENGFVKYKGFYVILGASSSGVNVRKNFYIYGSDVYNYTNFDIDDTVFTIDGVEYTVPSNIETWEEFCNYNSAFEIVGNNVVNVDTQKCIYKGDSYFPEYVVKYNDVISNNGVYNTTTNIKTVSFVNNHPNYITTFHRDYEAGMTWYEFVYSKYNTNNNFTIDTDIILYKNVPLKRDADYTGDNINVFDYIYPTPPNYGTNVEWPI